MNDPSFFVCFFWNLRKMTCTIFPWGNKLFLKWIFRWTDFCNNPWKTNNYLLNTFRNHMSIPPIIIYLQWPRTSRATASFCGLEITAIKLLIRDYITLFPLQWGSESDTWECVFSFSVRSLKMFTSSSTKVSFSHFVPILLRIFPFSIPAAFLTHCVGGLLESVTAVRGQRQGDNLEKSPVHRKVA